MEGEQAKFSILMFPWLAHGHIFPNLELAKRLSKRNFTIYFCSASINLDSIKTNLAEDQSVLEDSIKLIELAFKSPELPPELHTTKNLPPNLLPTLIQDFQKSKSSFQDIVNSLRPDLLILDYFQPWAAKYALSRGIPSVCFLVIGAAPVSYHHHEYTHGTSLAFPYPAVYLMDQERVDYHGRVTVHIKDADDAFMFGMFNLSSDIILVHSSKGLEQKYIDYLSILSKKQIVPTGPLVVHSDDEDEENSEIMKWLRGKDQFSTVYVSFGSECFLSKEQINEIAKGLELCKVNFIWIIRFAAGENAIPLPLGFQERVKERGIVVSEWAPQTGVLGHESTGGFVSHCGWNSVMESVYFGVPVIAMPMRLEQPLNSRALVEAGVGVEVEKDHGNRLYLGEEIAKAIDKVIVDKETGKGMRRRAKSLSDKIRENGEEELDEAAEQLMRLCMKKYNQQDKC